MFTKIFPEEAERIFQSLGDISLLDAEEVILEGLSHCSIGKLLANRWHLAEGLSNVLLLHHSPFSVDEPSELVLCVYLANIICKNNSIGLVLDNPPIEVDSKVYDALSIEPSVDKEILEVLEEELTKATEFLKV